MKTLKFIVGSVKATKTVVKGVIKADRDQINDGVKAMASTCRDYMNG